MTFVQIIDARSSRFEELKALDAAWQAETKGRRTLRRQIVGRDRNDERHFLVTCFFDSYDSAMANSALPETQAGAAKYAELMDGAPTFHDLDVIEDRTLDEAGAAKPGFLQIFECRTTRIDDMQELDREYERAISDRTTVRRSLVTQDRNDPQRFVIVVFFDSYDSAMVNSNLPETSALAEKMGKLLDGPPVFHDLDVLDDVTL